MAAITKERPKSAKKNKKMKNLVAVFRKLGIIS